MKRKAGKQGFRCLIQSFVFFLIFFSVMPPALADGKGERSFIVDSVVGDVFIQKAGGAKEVLVYPGTAFQEGDMLRTEEGSSVTISSKDRDDSLVLTENTELFAETLSERSGVKQTRLRVLAGSVYAEVEPLYESADSFEIVNPAAAIAARGTHFSISIDPVTGLPSAYVYSGVVNTESRQPAASPIVILPGQQITMYPGASQGASGVVTPLDFDELTGDMNDEILRKLLENKDKIEQENEQFGQEILNGYAAQQWIGMNENGLDPGDINRISQNLENLVGNIIKRALERGTVDKERIEQLIEEINNQGSSSRIDLDDVKPWEDPSGEGLKQAQEERERLDQQKREQQERREQQKEEYEERNKELLERMQEKARQQQEANQRAKEEAQNNAINRYLEQLSEAERVRFEEAERKRAEERERAQQEREQRQPQPPSPPNPPSGGSSGGGGGGGSSPSPTIVEVIQPEPVKVEAGGTFTPPAQVVVGMSNGTTRAVPVQWGEIPETSRYGIYTIHGTIAGYGGEVALEVRVYAPYDQEGIDLTQKMIPFRDGMLELHNVDYVPDESIASISRFPFTEEEGELTGLAPAGAILEFRQFEIGSATVKLHFDVEAGVEEDDIGIFHQDDDGLWDYIPTTIENGRATAVIEGFYGTYGVFYAEKAEFPEVSPKQGLAREGELLAFSYDDHPWADEYRQIYYQKTDGEWEIVLYNFTAYESDWNGNLKAIYPNHLFSEPRLFYYTDYSEAVLEGSDSHSVARISFTHPVMLNENNQLVVNGRLYQIDVPGFSDYTRRLDEERLELTIEFNELLSESHLTVNFTPEDDPETPFPVEVVGMAKTVRK
ncbi:FecR domain-containing protein [Alkalihalobacillus oceani]|uniref:Ig-like domain-containing protein n=1 Tax=Halalkalibacter oceani TaxID=1653776 RepID=UPI00203B381B|nr:Ig-like domain-containing protein [Halalkalibacter oceani]MCM3761001.1 FecR domain-containing protein [Halalkalibacter oceani]